MYFDKTADELLHCKVCDDDTTLHCMRCHKPYCSRTCQRLDWSTKKEAGNRYGDHKVVCYKLAGPYNAFVQQMMTPPPRPPAPPSQADQRVEPPTVQPVRLRLWPPFWIDSKARADGATQVYIAARNGDTDAVKVLIAAGCDVNRAKNTGATPVSIAAQKGHTSVVEALIAAGCDVNQAWNDGTAA